MESLKNRILEIKKHMIECDYPKTPDLTFPLDLNYNDILLLDDYFIGRLDDQTDLI